MKTIAELIQFLFLRKKLWMLPMILIFILFGLLLIASQGSVIAPFIYTVF